MKKTTLIAAAFLVSQSAHAQTSDLDKIPELPYDSEIVVSNLNMPPNVHLGEVAGVSTDSKGNIYVFSRTGGQGDIEFRRAAQLYQFGPDGKYIREIGGPNNAVMAWAHSVRIDAEDNIWIVDNGTNLITKFNQQGQILLTLGRRSESHMGFVYRLNSENGNISTVGKQDTMGMANNEGLFWEPTDVAFDSKGNIFVSDGYKNSQVQKFTRDGEFVMRWGTNGTGPGQFRLPHGIAVGPKDEVYVADRSNNRIQVFDNNGKYLREFKLDLRYPKDVKLRTPGLGKGEDGRFRSLWPNSICISKGPNPVIYSNDITPSLVIKMSLDGKVLGRFGREGRKKGEFAWMHEMSCGRGDNEVYLSEMINMRVQKVTLK
jgi:sugar lactone lactonase YvrE